MCETYDMLLRCAAMHGPLGVAFVIPIEPEEIGDGLTTTVLLFHGAADEPRHPANQAVFAGLAAEQLARRNGVMPRVTAW